MTTPTPTKGRAHTPGPWKVQTTTFCGNGPLIIEATNPANRSKYELARVRPAPFNTEERLSEKWANAHLIAAAPEMLQALKDALEWMDPDNETDGLTEDEFHSDEWNVCIRIRAAIDKAEDK